MKALILGENVTAVNMCVNHKASNYVKWETDIVIGEMRSRQTVLVTGRSVKSSRLESAGSISPLCPLPSSLL